MCKAFGLKVEVLENAWDHAVDPGRVEDRLRADTAGTIRAVAVVHNETSTGITHDVAGIGAAIRASGHPALLIVDTISSLASMDFRMDEWGVDVAVAGSPTGLMLPVGLGISAASERALQTPNTANTPRTTYDRAENKPGKQD